MKSIKILAIFLLFYLFCAKADNFSIQSTNLVSYISEGVVFDSVGNFIKTSPSTVTNLPNTTNYIVLTISDGKTHSLRRNYHSGSILLGVLISDTNNIVSTYQPSSFRFPVDPLVKTKNKLKNGQPVSIAILGTSLMDVSSGTNVAFRNLLFSTNYSGLGFNVTNASKVSQLKYSQGSTGPHFSFAMLGKAIGQPLNNYIVDTRSLGISIGLVMGANSVVPTPYQESLLSAGVDLIIIDVYNPGYASLSYIELQLKEAAKNGTEIIIIPAGPKPSDFTFKYSQGDALFKMAQANGWAICDINAFQRAALEFGDSSYFYDGVHQSKEGNEFYANRIKDILNNYFQEPAPKNNSRFSSVSDSELGTYAKYLPEIAEVLVNPSKTDGLIDQPVLSGSSALSVNPLTLFGGKTSTNSITILGPGQYAIYGHPFAYAWDLMVEVSPTETVNFDILREAGATLVKNINLTFPSSSYGKQIVNIEMFNPIEVVSTYSSSFLGDKIGYNAGLGNLQFRIKNNSTNDLRIVAPIAHTLRNKEVDTREYLIDNGLWTEENGYWGGPNNYKTLGTDTIGANLRFNYKGRGIILVLQKSYAGGQIKIVHDGVSLTANLYASNTSFTYFLAAPDVEKANGNWNVASRQHSMQVYLTSATSSLSSSVGLRKLTIVGGYIIE